MPFDDVLAAFDPALGLEVHVELNTASKMFCGCPGGLRRRAQPRHVPDLPGPARRDAGRQRQGRGVGDPDRPRAQLRHRRVVPLRPEELLLPGHAQELPDLAVRRADRLRRLDGRRGRRQTFRVEIERAHMEEDTGKSLHVGGSTGRIHGADYSLVDYNRAGIPLIEIVSRSWARGAGPQVARAYVAQLRELLLALGVSEARMDQGNLRCRRQPLAGPEGHRRPRHPHRDQERQLVPLRSSGPCASRCSATPPSSAAAARSSRRPGTGTRTPA